MFEDKIAERILEFKNRKIGPFEIQLNPTNRCNLRCRFCWLRDFDKENLNREEIDTRRYKQIIKECSELKVHTIEITGGGEPLMRKDILEMMKWIKKYKMFGRLITNGTLFNEKMINEMVKINWDEIVFSLDAPRKEINDFLRGDGFEKVVNSIKSFQLKKIKLKKDKPLIHIHMVLCNKNYHLLPEMFEFVYNLNCRNLLVEPIVLLAQKTKAGSELLFRKKDKKMLLKYLKKATQIAHEHNFQTNVDKLEFELIKKTSKMKEIIEKEGMEEKNPIISLPCYQPFYRMIIRPWGIVGPCCMFDNDGDDIHNKTLKEIWFGDFFENIRKKMMKRELPDFCSKCNPSQIQENRKIRTFLKNIIYKKLD